MEEALERAAVMSRREVDDGILDACRRGDRDAFRCLYEIYGDRVYTIALHHTGDEALARDVTQQVFVKLMTRIDQYRRDAAFTTWLYRLVVNACLDERRKTTRLSPLEEGECDERRAPASAEEQLLRDEVGDHVRHAVESLQPKLRIAVLLRYFEDLSYEEMSGVLGISMGTVASRLSRGHRLLAEKLAYLRGAGPGGDA
jgi:RNA polymerase sigma-70 factor (ECF subfamily)